MEENTSKGLILIVDDNEEIRNSLSRILEVKGYIVDTAKNGKIGLEKVRNGRYDIVLMDINMPEMNGVEAVKTIKSISPNTFIVMMTGEAEEQDISEAIKSGGFSCLRKPFDLNIFLARIKKLREESASQHSRLEEEAKKSVITKTEEKLDSFFGNISKKIKKYSVLRNFVLVIVLVLIGWLFMKLYFAAQIDTSRHDIEQNQKEIEQELLKKKIFESEEKGNQQN